MSRSTSQTSSVTGTTTNGLSRTLSLKTNTKAVRNPLPSSDVKVFVTNLRLLDLDLRLDWPKITVQTFSAKHADQKQRMVAVEWSLFRLFEIWDPAGTSQKLQPFFPPLEPLQARNLRNALYRLLEMLKREGVLGRESVLRKTMLDECKGDRFYEILALFSTAVLKNVLASEPQDGRGIAVARNLSTANALPRAAQESLLPLAIAHKAALTNVLKRKDEKRRRFMEFERLLNTRKDSISQRIRKCKDTPRARKPAIPQKESDAIKKQLKDNWVGNKRWLDVMLHGDDTPAEDAFLTGSFSHVWYAVEQGRKVEDAVPEVGLLENLQLRVEEQQTRLDKWKRFQETLLKGGSAASSTATNDSITREGFTFDDHLQLQLCADILDEAPVRRPSLRPVYQEILSEMDDELSHIATAKQSNAFMAPARRRGSSHDASRPPAQRRKSRSGSYSKSPVSPFKPTKPAPPSRKQSKEASTARPELPTRVSSATPFNSEATLVGNPSTIRTAAPSLRSVEPPADHEEGPFEETSDPLPTMTSPPPAPRLVETHHPSPTPPPAPSSYFPIEPPVLEALPLSSEEALAAQIVCTIGDATPSPVKKSQPRLSLMDRTRMSMAHSLTFQPIEESPGLPSPPLPEPPTVRPELERQQSLLERTRQSMAAMSAKPRPSLAAREKRRSIARQSIFPVNQFDTPRGRQSYHAIEETESEQKTPKEDLFSDEIDYDRVFKSRPRIATSPVFGTPGAGDEVEEEDEYDEGVTGVDLADVDADDDDDVTQAWENSPLRGAGKGRTFN